MPTEPGVEDLQVVSPVDDHQQEMERSFENGKPDRIDAFGAATTAAMALAERLRRTDVPLRRGFLARTEPSVVPPLANILRGGRGGDVRLKLYLTYVWSAVGHPHDVTAPARFWATLLGLSDPEGNGARQVRAATRWLRDRQLIALEEHAGQPTTVFLQNETGDGSPYSIPGLAIAEARESERDYSQDLYVKVPVHFWTSGWIVVLSAPAVAMLLLLLEGTRPGRDELWLSPRVAHQRYALSEGTRTTGFRELERHGLVAILRRPVRPGLMAQRRFRNTYSLKLDRMTEPPAVPRARQETPHEDA